MLVAEATGETMADDVLLQMITQNDDKHEKAHRRLRESLTELAEKVESNYQYLKDGHTADKSRIDAMEKQLGLPIDTARLALTPRVVFTIVTICIALAGGIWSSTSGLRSDVRDILTRMDAQKTAQEATIKLQELQSKTLQTAIDDMKRRQELQQYEIQQLKEVILGRK